MTADATETVRAHILARAAAWYPELADAVPCADLIADQERAFSRILVYRLRAEPGVEVARLLVKIPHLLLEGDDADPVRPRVVPRVPLNSKFALEHAALSQIHDHFTDLGDPRFGTVRVLDRIPSLEALVVEHLPHPTLAGVFKRAVLSPRRSSDVLRAFRHTGAWLEEFHGTTSVDASARDPRREDFLAAVDRLAAHVCEHVGARMVDPAVRAFHATAPRVLPTELPMGRAHGDLGLANVLVAASGRVIVFDTVGRWYAPVFEDLAYLTMAMRTNRAMIMTQGRGLPPRRLSAYEMAFIEGYRGGTPLDMRPIRLYQGLMMLDKWSHRLDQLARHPPAEGVQRRARVAARRAMTTRFFRRTIADVIEQAGLPLTAARSRWS